MNDADQATDPFDDIKLVPEPSKTLLNERQLIDYRTEREHCLDWLLTFGKDPDRADGYAKTTVETSASDGLLLVRIRQIDGIRPSF